MAAKPTAGMTRIANMRRTSSKDRRHQHLLDTGVRTSEAGRQRNRKLFGMMTKMFIAAALLGGLYVGGMKLWARMIVKNPQYNISELNVETDGILNPEDVLEAADLHKGANIFRVDLARAQARVAAMPQVEKVLITRQLPNRVAIQISERKPVAWIAPAHVGARDDVIASKQSWLIDTNGILLRSKKLNLQDRFLPIVRNYTEGPFAEGQEAGGEEIKAALDLLRAQQESSNNTRFQIQEIDLSKHFGLMVTDRNNLQVLFGLDEMDRQLKRLDVCLQALDQHAQKPQTINLLVQRNVPVTFMVDAVTTDKPASTPANIASSISPTSAATPAKDKGNRKTKQGRAKKRNPVKPAILKKLGTRNNLFSIITRKYVKRSPWTLLTERGRETEERRLTP